MGEQDPEAIIVNVENFARAETDRMFFGMLGKSGGKINVFYHEREPTQLDAQNVIRMNRDTLYSGALVNISKGATVTVPDTGDRYVSVGIYNQDNYVNRVLHDPGTYDLTIDEFDTPFVGIVTRWLVDANDPADIANVHALQDKHTVSAVASQPFVLPNYDSDSYQATFDALITLGRGLTDLAGMAGARKDVDPVRHLIGTAMAWGGLPREEVLYANVDPGLPLGEFRIRVKDVPVDAFWSVTVYNKDGYLEQNDRDAYNVNSINGVPDADEAITVHFGGCADGRPNCLPITEGWNYGVRMYQPRDGLLDGTWTFPAVEPMDH